MLDTPYFFLFAEFCHCKVVRNGTRAEVVIGREYHRFLAILEAQAFIKALRFGAARNKGCEVDRKSVV